MKKRKTKNLAVLILIFVLLLIILATCMTLVIKNIIKNDGDTEDATNYVTTSEGSEEYNEAINETKEQFINEGKIVPDNYNFLARIYEGDIEDSYLYRRIYELIYEIIPQTNEALYGKTDTQIEEYFYENEEQIQSQIGVSTVEEYVNFVNEISKTNDETYMNSVFDIQNYEEGNYDEASYYDKVTLNISFSNNIEISIKVYILDVITEETAQMSDIKFLAE